MENTLSNAQLVSKWNNLVNEALSIGLTGFRIINSKFKTNEEGLRRIEALESAIRARTASERVVEREEPAAVEVDAPAVASDAPAVVEAGPEQESDMARKKKSRSKRAAPLQATRRTRVSSANGLTIKEKWEEFNRLVPGANRNVGSKKYRVHTSYFGSHEAADKALAAIKADC